MKKFVASLVTVGLATVGLVSGTSALAAQADQDMPSMKARVAQLEATLAQMSQQDGRPAQANGAWSKYIRVSGGVNVDTKLVGSLGLNDTQSATNAARTPGRFTGENVRRVGINDAFLNVDADVNDWISGRVGVTYSAVTDNYNIGMDDLDTDLNFHVDQAYVTMANFDKQPYYMRAGLQYVDFGSYSLHPITKPFTQVMTEINDVAIQVGALDMSGVNGSFFIMQTPYGKAESPTETSNRRQVNYGGSLSYDYPSNDDMAYHVKVGYLENMVGLDSFARVAGASTWTYTDAIPMGSLAGGVSSGPFAANFEYDTAFKSFHDDDGITYQVGRNAKPKAVDLNVSYKFKYLDNRDNTVVVGYDRSWEASVMGLPRDRYYVDYTVGLYKNTDVTLEWTHDNDYSSNNLNPDGFVSSGRNFNVVSARLAVNFG